MPLRDLHISRRTAAYALLANQAPAAAASGPRDAAQRAKGGDSERCLFLSKYIFHLLRLLSAFRKRGARPRPPCCGAVPVIRVHRVRCPTARRACRTHSSTRLPSAAICILPRRRIVRTTTLGDMYV
ncbi:hypothetical protein MTO96_009867 [Rhipicephalus appendiculatus]